MSTTDVTQDVQNFDGDRVTVHVANEKNPSLAGLSMVSAIGFTLCFFGLVVLLAVVSNDASIGYSFADYVEYQLVGAKLIPVWVMVVGFAVGVVALIGYLTARAVITHFSRDVVK